MMPRIPHLLARSMDLLRLAGRGFGPFVDLVLRLALAESFWVSGLVKIGHFDTALYLSRHEYPVSWMDPVAAAYVGVCIEVIAPLFIAAGLMTRLFALPLLALTLVIQFAYVKLPEQWLWVSGFAWLILRGPGALSLDAMIAPSLRLVALPGTRAAATIIGAMTSIGEPLMLLALRLALAFYLAGAGSRFGAGSPEVWMAMLVAAGTLTRPLVLAGILVPGLVVHQGMSGSEMCFLGLVAAQLVVRGGGCLSVDHLLKRAALSWNPEVVGMSAAVPADAPKIVVLGAGFGGISVVAGLRFTTASVTLVDRNNYHLFQPLLYQVATASLSPADIATPIREVFRDQPNARILMGTVIGVDTGRRQVILSNGKLDYDYLVVATGARHSYFGKDQWEGVAPGLKRVEDATRIRSKLLLAFERAECSTDEEERKALLTFVIVGGGPTGVELAGAIAELARFGMASDFRSIDPATARVILVEAGSRLLAAFPESLSEEARVSLEGLGVEVHLNGRVEAIDESGVTISGMPVSSRCVLWAAGVAASPAGEWLGAEIDRAGRVKVTENLSVPGHPNIFVVGDTAAMVNEDRSPIPGLAPAAKQSGAYVAAVLDSRVARQPEPERFHYTHLGNLATIGRKAAVADFGLVRLTGMVAWWLWGGVHLALLVGARNRTAVLVDWFWSYLTFRRGIRLITGEDHM